MRRKKITEAEKNMGESRRGVGRGFFPAECFLLLLGASGMWLLGGFRDEAPDRLLANCVMLVLGLAMTGLQFRRECSDNRLDYNNGEHALRFLGCLCIGLLAAFACGFLPVGGWPFLPVFVMLCLFSSMSTGILASSVLLLAAVLLSGSSAGIYALYLFSGMFAAVQFRQLESEFKIGMPLILSLLFLLVCETANIVLVANARPDAEMFVIPAVNMIISSILLLGLLKLFSSMVVYQDREKYLEINDTENPALARLRQEKRQEYMHSIHTAYFCGRLAKRLGLDADALKCAAYYYRLGDGLEAFMEEKRFPQTVRRILSEYENRKQGVTQKETAVLLCADTVVSSVTYMQQKGPDRQVDYDRVIDAIFKKLYEEGVFDRCNITMEELRAMQRTFKEEKLYYDFLH